ncbi:alkaline phosphatase [Marininema halotolerans]|uniref:Alkaline phosphatase n=1 Tax=Marininema halotolerans TaxID=1155944 RepID=A0A1I6RK58_9BACL|nr:alkaline phosphatase [Marininema halotolerans]SFS65072.1 alkaline phosphatase [Marininema halotolerans]
MYRKRAWISGSMVAAAALLTVSITPAWASSNPSIFHHSKHPKNVILMVGDGMGAAQRQAIRLSKVGLNNNLAMDDLSKAGLVHTSPDDPKNLITDSAASATAMASGVKTYNGAIGVNGKKQPVPTVLEKAKKMGKATGLVTTSQITDATPAAFGAHVETRRDQSEIARQFIEVTKPDVLLGGGENYFYPEGTPGKFADDDDSKSIGKSNLIKEAQDHGYAYVYDQKGLQRTKSNRILGLFANEEMFTSGTEGDPDATYNPAVPLTKMTEKAISTLSKNRNGFFLMVEEEGTDEMSHSNNAKLAIQSGIEFDNSVAIAKAYAEKHRDTLVIVVGDHETGGMTIEDTNKSDESGDGISQEDGPFPIAHSDKSFIVDWTSTSHTGVDIPLTSMGPGSKFLTGTYENTHIHDVMLRTLKGY